MPTETRSKNAEKCSWYQQKKKQNLDSLKLRISQLETNLASSNQIQQILFKENIELKEVIRILRKILKSKSII